MVWLKTLHTIYLFNNPRVPVLENLDSYSVIYAAGSLIDFFTLSKIISCLNVIGSSETIDFGSVHFIFYKFFYLSLIWTQHSKLPPLNCYFLETFINIMNREI